MARFVVGDDRSQSTLFPERLDEYLGEDNPVRAIDVFVDELDLAKLGFGGVEPEVTGRPAYHPATLLKIYVYGYLNRVQSSRRLERECQRNIELVWLTGRLMPDFKTIADFRKDNGEAIVETAFHIGLYSSRTLLLWLSCLSDSPTILGGVSGRFALVHEQRGAVAIGVIE
jgi:transposase